MNKDILPVLDEISAVLKKHDMMGLIFVANGTHVDFRMEVSASWSVAKLEFHEGNVLVRIRCTKAEIPDDAERKSKVEKTVGTFVSFDHCLDAMGENIQGLLKRIAQQLPFQGKSIREE